MKTESSPSASKPVSPDPTDKKCEVDEKITVEVKEEKETSIKVESTTKAGENAPTLEINTRKNGSVLKKKTPSKPTPVKSPAKPKKTSQRLSAKFVKPKLEDPPATPERVKASLAVSTPKKKNQVVNFVPGSSIEAQNFDGKWIPVKVIEVDMDEREVLVRSCDKNNKSKTG